MNYLPLILLAIPLITKKENLYKEILSSITLEDLTAILPLLGIKEDTLKAVIEILPTLTAEEFDAQVLLKKLLPLFLTATSTPKTQNSYTDCSTEPLEPISSFANEEISNSLRAYFS